MKIPDYKNIDYRGFVFVVHEEHGLLLLHCTRKAKKGPHYQLPGGHVDDFEFEAAVKEAIPNYESYTKEDILIDACKMGAARELYEETGIDVRDQLERLVPVELLPYDSPKKLKCMLKHKCYFQLYVNDKDFFSSSTVEGDNKTTKMVASNDSYGPKHLMIKISEEHSGFIFEIDPKKSIKKLKKHSGGSGSKALQMSMQCYVGSKPNPNAPPSLNGEEGLDIPKQYSDYIDIIPPKENRGVFSCFC